MKVAFVSQWYDPEVGSAAIPGAIVRALQKRGHQVEVITGFPNYPHGSLYAGYRVRPYAKETVRGVDVHRVPIYPSHDSSAVRRVANFISFMISSSTLGGILARRCEVALIYSTPATVGLAGLALRTLFRKPFLLYVQDLWPDTLTATGMLPRRFVKPAEWGLHRFCNRVYKAAGHIAVTSPGMKALLVSRGVPANKIDVIYNWVDEELFRVVEPGPRVSGAFDAMYAGNIGDVQGLEVALHAVARLGPDAGVRLRFVGTGVAKDALQDLADALGLSDRVVFEGARRVDEMSEVMASASIQLVCLKDDPLFHLTMPSKIQAILAAGRPLITCAPGDAGRLTEASGAGWSVAAGDVEGLAAALREASQLPHDELERLGVLGRHYYEKFLAADVGSRLLDLALARAAETGARA